MNAPAAIKRKQPAAVNPNPIRKLRKSCSLPTCTRPPGTCMHCTCDGRCGRHPAGLCGGRREGSGRGCKKEGCTKDDKCLHSNRATCCHCRNLVSSSGRAAKRPRVSAAARHHHQNQSQVLPLPTPAAFNTTIRMAKPPTTSKLQTVSEVSEDLLEAELHAFLRDANLGGDLSLSEYTQWASRRDVCNLVVLVCGTQFNLHKHPMLLESHKLHRMARETLETAASSSCGGAVPVLELSAFPGGADMFEKLAIYCYTGEISFSLANLAVMHCAIEFLEMGEDVKQSAKRFLDQQMNRTSDGLNCLLQVVNAADTLTQAQPELFQSACDSLVANCMDALVERGSTVDADTMLQFFTLPSQRFTELTQRLLTSKVLPSSSPRSGSDIATELCVQAKLAQLHRDSNRSPSPSHRIKAQQCVQLLRGEAPDSPKMEKIKMKEELLDLELLLSADNSDKLLLKLMDEDLSACSVTSATSALVDASISFGSDSFRFDTHTLPETFVV